MAKIRSEDHQKHLRTRNKIDEIIESALRELWSGRDDIVILSEETTSKILSSLGIHYVWDRNKKPEYDGYPECDTCNGWIWSEGAEKWIPRRETTGMICQVCGADYTKEKLT